MWRAVVNALTNGFHKVRGISRQVEGRLASQEGLCCVELDAEISVQFSMMCIVSSDSGAK
jgi:hypothetical protein